MFSKIFIQEWSEACLNMTTERRVRLHRLLKLSERNIFFCKTTLRSVLAKLVNWAILCGKLYISDGGSILIREASEKMQSLHFMKYHLSSERRWQRWEAERCYRPDRQERGLSSEDTIKSRPAEVSRYYLRHFLTILEAPDVDL